MDMVKRGLLIEEKNLFNQWWSNPWNLPVNNKNFWSIEVIETRKCGKRIRDREKFRENYLDNNKG